MLKLTFTKAAEVELKAEAEKAGLSLEEWICETIRAGSWLLNKQ